MRSLFDTIGRLKSLRVQRQQAFQAADLSSDEMSDLLDFGSNPGNLLAKIHIPARLAPGAALVVVLHGCAQNAAGYDHGTGWSALAEARGFALLLPQQRRANNANLCFNWFPPEDSRRDSGEALSIRQMIHAMSLRYKVATDRVFITGLSAGGAMTSVMLAAYPEVFAGGAIIGGLPFDCAHTIPEAFDRMRGHGIPTEEKLRASLQRASNHAGPWPKISIWHGDADGVVSPANADAIAAQWRGVHDVGNISPIVEKTADLTKRIWRGADGGERIVEYRVNGMGHGTPISTGDQPGEGVAGPFMLDVGLSSTRVLAKSWGLMEGAKANAAERHRVGETGIQHLAAQNGLGENINAALAGVSAKSSGVKKIIEDALRSAGLMPPVG